MPSGLPSCSNYNIPSYRGQNNSQIQCACGAASGGAVWGTDIYTDDSDVCTAAVHAGVIPASGGNVTLTIRPGQGSYTGTTRNGFSTYSYGAWDGSYSFGGGGAPPPECSTVNVMAYRGQNGTQLRCNCSTVPYGASVWGSDLYTDDSNVCVAAAHMGVITSSGGGVLITIYPGQSYYIGSTRNGINTYPYGAWSGSFSVRWP
ncbi:hypothetical protein LZ198_15105 [Myxococcus sp. K15C18031901]|nr:hypothetical protein [Myxococcus dinghuensis]